MPKITIIGAGGYVFPLTLIRERACLSRDAPRLRRMVDEMFAAEAPWLPQFFK